MLGYTIDKSIELLEKRVKALEAGGGAANWSQLSGKPFNALGDELYNLDGDLTVRAVSSDKIALPESTQYDWENASEAIEQLASDSNHYSDDISTLSIEVNAQAQTVLALQQFKLNQLNFDGEAQIVGKFGNNDVYFRIVEYHGTIKTNWQTIALDFPITRVYDTKAFTIDNALWGTRVYVPICSVTAGVGIGVRYYEEQGVDYLMLIYS